MTSIARQKERACAVKMAASAQARWESSRGKLLSRCKEEGQRSSHLARPTRGDDPVIQWIVYLSRINRTLGEV